MVERCTDTAGMQWTSSGRLWSPEPRLRIEARRRALGPVQFKVLCMATVHESEHLLCGVLDLVGVNLLGVVAEGTSHFLGAVLVKAVLRAR